MKITASYILHYGKQWLFHSMRSVRPFVDEIRVFYTPKPSHGHTSRLQCPETREELYEISKQFDVVWHEGLYPQEGYHRDYAVASCGAAGAGIILVVDADEIWLPEELKSALDYVQGDSRRIGHYCVNMLHFWRSLRWVCKDGMWPVRIIVPACDHVTGYVSIDRCQPLHMGYAQTPEIIKYKMSIHGHKDEIRPNWFEQKFLAWQSGMGDVHPTCVDTWTPRPYDKGLISDVVGDHPYFHSEIIE